MQMTKKQGFTLSVLILFSIIAGHSQDIFRHLQSEQPNQGKINIYQSYQIEKVVDLYTQQREHYRGISGYKINIYTNSGQKAKSEAIRARAKLQDKFDVKIKMAYESSWWNVYAGEFLTKSEARKFLNDIDHMFPYPFIVRDYIEIPK
jgi:hypothetical protein